MKRGAHLSREIAVKVKNHRQFLPSFLLTAGTERDLLRKSVGQRQSFTFGAFDRLPQGSPH